MRIYSTIFSVSIPSKLSIKVHIEAAQYTKRMSQPCSRTTISYWTVQYVFVCTSRGVVRNIEKFWVPNEQNCQYAFFAGYLSFEVPNNRVSRRNKRVGSK